MLKPFLIRDLHDDPLQQNIVEDSESDLYNATDIISIGPHRQHGLVQLSAADYDEIAFLHPQARLTYLDDDDGEMITVGSALELSQRLDEPPTPETDTGFPETIHLFDIRRRKSVVDLWKKFGLNESAVASKISNTNVIDDNLDDRATTPDPHAGCDGFSEKEQAVAVENDSSESFLSAFEAEMAKVMNESHSSTEDQTAEGSSSPRAAQAESTSSLPRETADAFASALRNLIEVAELISSGVKSKLPELERQLENARRALPSDITDSMRNAFLLFEEHVKAMASTLNNFPETIRRENEPGGAPLFPEFPAPHSAIRGLREMGVQLGGMGQSLLDAFESGVRGAFPGQMTSYFSNFTNFANASNQRGTVPNVPTMDVPDPRHGEALSDNLPAATSNQDGDVAAMRPPQQPPLVVSGATMDRRGGSRNMQQPTHSHSPPNPFAQDRSSYHGGLHAHTQFPPNYQNEAHPFWGYNRPRHRPHRPIQFPRVLPAPFDSGSQPPSFYPNLGHNTTLPSRPVADSSHDGNGPSPDFQSTRSLFIGNVGYNVTERMVQDVFESRGVRVDVSLPQDSRTRKHAGFGYLTFATTAEATHVLRDLQGLVIDGHSINLEYVDNAPITSISPANTTEEQNPANTASPQTSGVVRRDIGEANVSGSSTNTTRNDTVHDMLLAETEARFPPVSQLDAHMLARQSAGSLAAPLAPDNKSDSGEASQAPSSRNASSSQPLPGSFPQDPPDDPSLESATATSIPNTLPAPHIPSHRHRPQSLTNLPRRAATVRSREPHRVSFDPFDAQPALRRRATERHPPWGGPHMGVFGPRHRASLPHVPQPSQQRSRNLSAHEEEPIEEAFKKEARVQRAIDECVSALVQLGYGTENDGGLQRITVYAAAANGELVDAIEMIEEERKAYEQRG
ncbi:uncharacterized protein BJX67DRAFT_327543 [Aspergillus lucknowensis]|uniref:RRM domain-containing protein n=1 Tax=Aspergillus lucknowensis TaxID=176173 RepID=A0ABR4LB93_9EURO